MPSKYFEFKIKTDKFKEETSELIKSLEGQRILIYGAGQSFFTLNNIYDFKHNLDIIAIADKKFNELNKNITGLKQISPKQIVEEDFDKLIITNEQPRAIRKFLISNMQIPENKILQVFNEEFREEAMSYNYLYEHNFDKTLPKLVKKLRNKTVVLYGAGIFLEAILKYFDLSGLNIIGIADKKFEGDCEIKEFKGYKTIAPSSLTDVKPDYLIIATKFYISLVEEMYETLKKSKIKIKPLVYKSFITLVKEIWK